MERRFAIIGVGPGGREYLTGEAMETLGRAELVLAPSERLAGLCAGVRVCPFGEMAVHAIRAGRAETALLVSGDVGFFSAAGQLYKDLLPYGGVRLVCGLSSLQYFCARLYVPYENVCVRSLHGRAGSILGAVSYHRLVFVLTGGEQTADAVCRTLAEAGLGHLTVHLGENLGAADERIETGSARSLAEKPCGGLAVLLVEHPDAADAAGPVRDDMLTRGRTPMTKEEVRWVSVSRLAVRPRDTVWDVGAGTGAVTLELARRASDGLVYAVERDEAALGLLAENREKLGGYNVQVIRGSAPDALAPLPAPDAVFIGGSGGCLRGILEAVRQKNPAARVAVNAVTLETLHEAREAMHALGFAPVEITQLAVTRGRAAGAYTMLSANNPVFILSGGGGDGA